MKSRQTEGNGLITTEPELFINGRFRRAETSENVIEAATEEPRGRGPNATTGDIDDAVEAARRALPGWRSTPASTRAAVLERLADALEARGEETAELCTGRQG